MAKVTIEVDVTMKIEKREGKDGKKSYRALFISGPHRPCFIGRAAARSILSDFDNFKSLCEELVREPEDASE